MADDTDAISSRGPFDVIVSNPPYLPDCEMACQLPGSPHESRYSLSVDEPNPVQLQSYPYVLRCSLHAPRVSALQPEARTPKGITICSYTVSIHTCRCRGGRTRGRWPVARRTDWASYCRCWPRRRALEVIARVVQTDISSTRLVSFAGMPWLRPGGSIWMEVHPYHPALLAHLLPGPSVSQQV